MNEAFVAYRCQFGSSSGSIAKVAGAPDVAVSSSAATAGAQLPRPPNGNGDRSDGTGRARSDEEVRGSKAFKDAFTATFELCWSRGREMLRTARDTCPEGEDVNGHKMKIEVDLLSTCASAAICAAEVVAHAARLAAEARAKQPAGAAVEAWDMAWARASSALLRSWREEAVAGRLDAKPNSEQGIDRRKKVEDALAAAERAAMEAIRSEQARRSESSGRMCSSLEPLTLTVG